MNFLKKKHSFKNTNIYKILIIKILYYSFLIISYSLFLSSCIKVITVPQNTNPSRDNNILLGNPSNANTTDEDNYLMNKSQFVLSYNRSRGSANWVSWHLSKAWKGTTERTNNFKSDNTLPNSWENAISTDYVDSGFDRGHLCPSDDRDGSVEDNEATFLMTNIVPQAPKNNQGVWVDLEEYCRKIMDAGNELYIIAGVYGKGGSGSKGGKNNTIADGKIAVAASLWKVIVILPVGTDDLNRIDENTRIIAVNIPNKQAVEDTKWGDYRLSIKDLEDLTGYDFLSNLPKSVQKTIEGRKDEGPTIKVSMMR